MFEIDDMEKEPSLEPHMAALPERECEPGGCKDTALPWQALRIWMVIGVAGGDSA
jgi:hypothetical protein